MRVHVVSDVHGRAEGLDRAGRGADALVCLGDLVLFVDYEDHGQGIIADLFGLDNAERFIALRSAKRFADAGAFLGRLWEGLDGEPGAYIRAAVHGQYERLLRAMPTPAYLTYGNVDLPPLLREHLLPGQRLLDGEVAELGGRVFGFVGGGLRSPYHTPCELDDESYAAKIAAVGSVDVLCCHIPPALPDLTYDVVARRFERGSEALLDAIRDTQPGCALFGHVHQPLVRRTRVGRTECLNVGHFRSTGEPFVLEW